MECQEAGASGVEWKGVVSWAGGRERWDGGNGMERAGGLFVQVQGIVVNLQHVTVVKEDIAVFHGRPEGHWVALGLGVPIRVRMHVISYFARHRTDEVLSAGWGSLSHHCPRARHEGLRLPCVAHSLLNQLINYLVHYSIN